MREAFLVAAARTPIGKAPNGKLRTVRPDDLAAVAIKGALARVPQLSAEQIEDVILGCAMPEGAQGMNIARIACQRAGLPDTVPGVTVNRFCASGLEAIAMAAQRILSGMAEVIVAGGTEFGAVAAALSVQSAADHMLARIAAEAQRLAEAGIEDALDGGSA